MSGPHPEITCPYVAGARQSFARHWANLHKEQGSTEPKYKLEATYRALPAHVQKQFEAKLVTSTPAAVGSAGGSSGVAQLAANVPILRRPGSSNVSSGVTQPTANMPIMKRPSSAGPGPAMKKIRGAVAQRTSVSTSSTQAKGTASVRSSSGAPLKRPKRANDSENAGSSVTQPAAENEFPALDASILEEVRKLGRKPKEIKNPNTDLEKAERSLAVKIRKHRQKLLSATVSEIDNTEDILLCIREVRASRAQMPSDAPAELIRKMELLSELRTQEVYKKERYIESKEPRKRQETDWWQRAGIIVKPHKPIWCSVAGFEHDDAWHRAIATVPFIHYQLTCIALEDLDAWTSGDTHPAYTTGSQQRLYNDFFSACRSPQRRLLEPFSELLHNPCRSRNFKPHQCLRQLALIELKGTDYMNLPLRYDALLTLIENRRENEEHQCQVLSEMHEAAVQRLIEYSRDVSNICANARFLNLQETLSEDGANKTIQCQTEVAAQTTLRSMVRQLAQAFDKEGVDMTHFKPNHFATLSVYYSQFLRKDKNKPCALVLRNPNIHSWSTDRA